MMSKNRFRFALCSLFGLCALACGGDKLSDPGRGQPLTIRIVSGGQITDTVDAILQQSLVVEVRDSSGQLARDQFVQFRTVTEPSGKLPILIGTPTTSFGFQSFSKTDLQGQASSLVRLGPFASVAHIAVSVQTLGIADTVSYTVLPGKPNQLLLPTRDTTVDALGSFDVRASIVDRERNVTSATLSFTARPGIQSVSATGHAVAGEAIARSRIVISSGSFIDSEFVTVLSALPMVGLRRAAASVNNVGLVKLNGAEKRDLATGSDASTSPHSVSAATSVVYYQGDPIDGSSVWIVAPGDTPRQLVGAAQGFVSASFPRLSPDAVWVYFTGTTSTAPQSLWRIHRDGTGLEKITPITSTEIYTASSISPNGQTVTVPDDAGFKLVTVATKASTTIRSECGGPRFSPDGLKLACLKNGKVSTIDIDGTNRRTLVSSIVEFGIPDDVAGIDWSPDGVWLVGRLDSGPCYLVNASDGTIILLTRFAFEYAQLSFVR